MPHIKYLQMRLLFSKRVLYLKQSIKARSSLAGRFRSKGKIHLSKWQPEVWNYENYLKGGCHDG